MREILDILQALQDTGSSKEKIEILKSIGEGPTEIKLKYILLAAYNPYKIYNISSAHLNKLKKNKEVGSGTGVEVDRFIIFLEKQSSKVGCTNQDLEDLVSILSKMTEEVASFCLLILKKDLRIGMAAKSINKAFPGLIPVFDVELCKPVVDIPSGAFLVSPKLDGLRCIAVPSSFGYVLFSRNGKPLIFPEIVEVLNTHFGKTNLVFDGEIMGSDWNSSMKITRKTNRDVSGLKYNIMDAVSLNDWNGTSERMEPVCKRYNRLIELMASCNSEWLNIIPHVTMDDSEAIFEFYTYCLEADYEGIVLKEVMSVYDKKRGWLKKKPTDTYDLKVVDLIEGTGKNEGILGAFSVDLNGVIVNVGSGMKDWQRKEFWAAKEELIGTIIEVEADAITKDGSLRFPRFKSLRKDKDE